MRKEEEVKCPKCGKYLKINEEINITTHISYPPNFIHRELKGSLLCIFIYIF